MKRPMQSVINVRIVPRRGVGWAAIAVTCLVVARPVAAQGEYSLAAPATLATPTSRHASSHAHWDGRFVKSSWRCIEPVPQPAT